MTQCSTCGADAAGNFCASCGAGLAPATCPSCKTPSAPGARFCTECGAALGRSAGAPEAIPGGGGRGGAHGDFGTGAGGRPGAGGGAGAGPGSGAPGGQGSALIAWSIAGLLLVGFIVVIASPIFSTSGSSGSSAAGPAQAAPALGPAPNVDLNSMTPLQAANNLFDRVMRGVAAQDTTEIMNFLPMAIGAYERARPLDAEGQFDLSLLHRAGLDFEAALVEARAGLELHPDHILNLSSAAMSSAELGDSAAASEYYTRLLEVYDTESERDIKDYTERPNLLPQMRGEAEAFLAGTP